MRVSQWWISLVNQSISWKWQTVFIYLWTILCLSADLKHLHPRIHWVATALLLLPVMFVAYRQRNWLRWDGFSAPLLLLVALLVTSVTSSRPLYDLAEMAKLGIIFIAIPFLVTWPEYAATAVSGLIASAWLNIALLVCGVTLFPTLAHEMFTYRWGDVLNFPGSLVKTGILLFAYAAYRGLGAVGLSLKHIVLLFVSTVIVFVDGSRTGVLALGLGVVYVCGVLAWEHRWKRAVLAFAVMSAIILGAGFASPSRARLAPMVDGVAQMAASMLHGGAASSSKGNAAPSAAPLPAPSSAGNSAQPGQQNDAQSEPFQPDPARMEMIRVGLARIAAHPFFGSGMGSTMAQTLYGTMVMHNTYLQIWADTGLLGFIAYVWLVLGWVVSLPRVWRNLRRLEPADRSVYYGAIFMLIYFVWAGFFHPVSTEWSEWITFLIPYALYWQALRMPGPAGSLAPAVPGPEMLQDLRDPAGVS